MYVEGYPVAWITARSAKVAMSPPYVLSGIAYLLGYAQAALRRVPRFDEDGYRKHLHGELRRRAASRLRLSAPA